jgi:hypothetical protein
MGGPNAANEPSGMEMTGSCAVSLGQPPESADKLGGSLGEATAKRVPERTRVEMHYLDITTYNRRGKNLLRQVLHTS